MNSARVLNTISKFGVYLDRFNSICVSVSGGSDSDILVHIICTSFRQYLYKIHFVFADTGIEYQATKDHLKYLEEKYNISIDVVKGIPIPAVVLKYGSPFWSKKLSDTFHRLQKHKFNWSNEDFNVLYSKYPNNKASLRTWCNLWGEGSRFNIDYIKFLKQFMVETPPKFNISSVCCDKSKKEPLIKYQKKCKCDLVITGERKSEGGARASAYSSCFVVSHGLAKFMPLYYWSDETKYDFCRQQNIIHSDCYTVYGLSRTGCVGCPFARHLWYELKVMKEFEPKLYKFCWNVFGESYNYRLLFEQYRSEKNAESL